MEGDVFGKLVERLSGKWPGDGSSARGAGKQAPPQPLKCLPSSLPLEARGSSKQRR